MGWEEVEKHHVGRLLSLYLCHPPHEVRVSYHNFWVDDSSVWSRRKTKAVGPRSGRFDYGAGKLSCFQRLAATSTARRNLWFLD